MRIGIDARMYGPQQGGLGRYIEQLILNLEKLNPNADFVIFLRQDNWNDFAPSNQRFTKVLADVPWYGLREQFELPKIIRETKVDLMHFPHWNVPLFYSKPFVVTIHDLLLLHYPTRRASTLGPVLYFIKNLFFRLILRHAAKRSKKIITVSNFSKEDIVKNLNVSEEKITVTYLAANPVANPPLPRPSGESKIARPYALYVGVAYPHKNLDRLLEAWKIFYEKTGNRYQLVLVGKRNYFYDKLLKKFEDLLAMGQVIFTDFVDDQTLDNLYREASVYVFPSLYEGFGIPPLEAMLHGVPVVASSAASLPEILEGAALYFDPLMTNELAETLISAFENRKLREELSNLGKNILAKYSWLTTAKKTSEVYQNSV
ncbi:MAG: glycosyltransferase family 1 protein [Patescibacteria group bacterium]